MTAMACNIDAKGKAIRLIGGVITCAVAALLAILTALEVLPEWGWWAVLGTLAGGLFQVYEGWSGWCALRAIGVKTPW